VDTIVSVFVSTGKDGPDRTLTIFRWWDHKDPKHLRGVQKWYVFIMKNNRTKIAWEISSLICRNFEFSHSLGHKRSVERVY